MPLYKLSDTEVRTFGKEYIETLELWLRNIIDTELRKTYGSDYIHAKKMNSPDNVFNKTLQDEIDNRMANEPERYSRQIDACVLDTVIKILTRKDLYDAHFKKIFKDDFRGKEMLSYTLEKLVNPRNCLSHANPISIRQLEQIICYTNDVVTAIKKYFKEINMDKELNVPKIIRITDTFGNTLTREQFNSNDFSFVLIDLREKKNYLFPNDKLKIEVSIDPTFPRDSYKISWGSAKGILKIENSTTIEIAIEEKHIGDCLDIQCKIISNEVWHRSVQYDDSIQLQYKVLPNK